LLKMTNRSLFTRTQCPQKLYLHQHLHQKQTFLTITVHPLVSKIYRHCPELPNIKPDFSPWS